MNTLVRACMTAWLCCVPAPAAHSSQDDARAALLGFLDSQKTRLTGPHTVSQRYTAEELTGPALDLAANHPDFEPGDPARDALVHALLMVKDRQGRWAFEVRGARGDFLFQELQHGSVGARVMILNGRPALPGPYQAEICDFLSSYVSNIGGVTNVSVLSQSLRALSDGCGTRPELVETLRSLVLNGAEGIDPAVLGEYKIAYNKDISYIATQALLATAPDTSATIEWLSLRTDDTQARAARDALGIQAVMEGVIGGARFGTLDQRVQQQWIDALLRMSRAAPNKDSVWEDDIPRLIIVGNRFPHLRESIGVYFMEVLAAGARTERDAETLQRILRHWSITP